MPMSKVPRTTPNFNHAAMRANPMWRLLLSAVAVTAFQSPQISVRTHALRIFAASTAGARAASAS